MKQKFSTIFILLLLFLAGSRVVAQNAPKPFDIEQPSLRVFLPAPELATGRAVVACPGGGYSHLAFEHEGCDWAPYFNKQGIALIVLKYRMPNGDRTLPISDAEAAMKLVRDSADVWNLNPNDIGIMGSSAGGHLASTIATHAKPELRPNFQILFYPVITMDKSYTHRGSHDNLLGKDASAELELEYSNEKQVTKDTPRAFIVYSDDDKVVPPANGVNYYLALNKNNVPSVLHIYPSGGHGWGIREGFLYKNEMLDEEKIGDDKINTTYMWINKDNKYLTIEFQYYGTHSDDKKHFLNLVINDKEETAPTADEGNAEDEYINLEFRHNSEGDDPQRLGEGYVSFKLDKIKDRMEGKKGLRIRVNTIYGGPKTYEVKFP